MLTRRGTGIGDGGGGLAFILRGMSLGENRKLCENGGNILLVVMAGEARVEAGPSPGPVVLLW